MSAGTRHSRGGISTASAHVVVVAFSRRTSTPTAIAGPTLKPSSGIVTLQSWPANSTNDGTVWAPC